MQKHVVLEKAVGQTPLECAELWRAEHPEYQGVPLAYAGRLDPMASGKLLVLIGEECKRQEQYHGLDKTYEFEVLFGISSDSGDILGLVSDCDSPKVSEADLRRVAEHLTGTISLPYPSFSSKTFKGKPLHTWTLEGRLHEIEIPTYTSTIYSLQLLELQTIPAEKIFNDVAKKIETIKPVTDIRKAIGNDFRRPEVRASWQQLKEKYIPNSQNYVKSGVQPLTLQVAKFSCTCSSGTYMRTLAEVIARELRSCGLAYSIHRSAIGNYKPLLFNVGFWLKKF